MASMTPAWRWHNEPAVWADEDGVLTVTTDPDTDFWRTTHYGFVRDTGHLRGAEMPGDLVLTATFAADYRDRYDQAGLALRLDERNWIKTGIELVDGRRQLSAVVTREFSDWSVVPVDSPRDVTVQVTREGDAVTIRYGLDGAAPTTLLRLAYLPPGPVLAGVMAASPTGGGFRATFTGLTLSGPPAARTTG